MLRTRLSVCALAGTIAGVASALPAQAATYQQIYVFQGGADGSRPTGLTALNGMLYGTTIEGGKADAGTVFSLNLTNGAERVLYAFSAGSDGGYPEAALLAYGGLLYGTTTGGGSTACAGGCGTVFSVQPSSGAETVVHTFSGGPAGNAGGHDGADPIAALIQVGSTLFGTTAGGGYCQPVGGCGTVYSVNPETNAESVVSASKAVKFGQSPDSSLVQVGARLYGTTDRGGGSQNCGMGQGCGTVFSVDPTTGVYQIIYAFQNGADGRFPGSGLLYFKGKLYGTTQLGGANQCTGGSCGTLFSVDVASGAFQVVANFSSSAFAPFGNLLNYAGTFYGTTAQGGGNESCGAVFAFHPTTGVLRVIHAFTGGNNGCLPLAGLLNVNGTLYGTTIYSNDTRDCSKLGCGTIFAIKP